ncbi:LysR family transcriptional regulator [Actinoplanes sp. DH11]|uniref:LysR family transcriptional regulator n=1 Tax=Actinoplanes sp. DH11 TaxID=2857011 RepID=UPI001E5DB49E|nr:LysR family transcriptional regulator [Actinoplanes sp. DH11]
MNLELRHFRALAAIGTTGTITGAADTLHISQPALSRTLEQMERRLGVRLVHRTTRTLSLTEAGQRLHDRARQILHQVDEAVAEVSTGAGPLRIGFAWGAFGEDTVPMLRTWRAEHPETPIQVHRRDDLEAALRRGEIDAALLRTAPDPDAGFEIQVVNRERRLAALPADDPLTRRPGVRLADLGDRPVVLCSTAATTAGLWPGHQRPRTFEVANVDEWLTVIATGEAAGVTAEATEHIHPHPGVRYVPLTDAPPVTVVLAWPRPATHAATSAFYAHLRRLISSRKSAAVSPHR